MHVFLKQKEKLVLKPPQIVSVKINPDKIGAVIGTGGKEIKKYYC